jgi:hypothetical protein
MTLPRTASVVLRSEVVALDSDIGRQFISHCARYTEGLISEAEMKCKWGLSDEAWRGLEHNAALLEAVRREHDRRLADHGATAEVAQRQFAKAPAVLGGILTNEDVSPRHRIEAARELRAIVAADRADSAQQGKPVTITINLGADAKYIYRMRPVVLDVKADEQ